MVSAFFLLLDIDTRTQENGVGLIWPRSMVGEVVFWQDVLRSSPLRIRETMNSAESQISSFFVYGTLCRGQCRANLWPVQPQQVVSAWVFGELFGRNDYPAMRPGGDRIAGECWQFDQNEVPKVIRALDVIEGTNQPNMANLYDRVTLEAFPMEQSGDKVTHFGSQSPVLGSGIPAYGYHYAIDPREHRFHRIPPRTEDGLSRWPN